MSDAAHPATAVRRQAAGAHLDGPFEILCFSAATVVLLALAGLVIALAINA